IKSTIYEPYKYNQLKPKSIFLQNSRTLYSPSHLPLPLSINDNIKTDVHQTAPPLKFFSRRFPSNSLQNSFVVVDIHALSCQLSMQTNLHWKFLKSKKSCFP
ncbi:uncharacterized protein LOC124890358, partial [Capsicum annuum]|uniref:uncharacterized protein LOC124890358 n=1 Tax=Capsicum annuum TaxID=4072 RepID=UPI001FB0B358